MTDDRVVEGAVLTQWIAVALGESTHLVGLLIGGHPLLAPGRWIITSPVVAYDKSAQIAVTASAGRPYHLLEPLEGAVPQEIFDLIEQVARLWKIPPGTTIAETDL
jgi:hypothetical protein